MAAAAWWPRPSFRAMPTGMPAKTPLCRRPGPRGLQGQRPEEPQLTDLELVPAARRPGNGPGLAWSSIPAAATAAVEMQTLSAHFPSITGDV